MRRVRKYGEAANRHLSMATMYVRSQEIRDNSIFRNPMKILRMLAGILIGVVVSTVVCWGLLFFWGIVGLHGRGSLFDTSPTIANAFFIGWAVIALICALAGAMVFKGKGRESTE